jgi:hypothetical protein
MFATSRQSEEYFETFEETISGHEVPECEPKPTKNDEGEANYKALYEALLKGNSNPSVIHSSKRDVNINIIVN